MTKAINPIRTLVIGDVHGHYDRLVDLLQKAGIIDQDCRRIDHQTLVIQLGDLGHFGGSSGSPMGDRLCWELAWEAIDLVLWGNHDRALISRWHAFSGFERPDDATLDAVKRMDDAGRIQIAAASHGFLMVHGGLHACAQKLVDSCEADPERIAKRLNVYGLQSEAGEFMPIIDNVSSHRFGPAREGGVLWCDWSEKRVKGVRQIVGHTVQRKHQRVRQDNYGSYNLDVGNINNGQLAGMWLPSEEVVEINRPDWGPSKIIYKG